MLLIFYVTLSVLRHPNAFFIVVATQLNPSVKVKFRLLGLIMFISGFLITCAFSSALLLSTLRNTQISTIDDLMAELELPHITLCMNPKFYLTQSVKNPGASTTLRALTRKMNEGRLLTDSLGTCIEQTAASETMISVFFFPYVTHKFNRVFIGKECLLTPTTGYVVGPGYPLSERANVLVGSLREMQIFDRVRRRIDLNETIKGLPYTVNPETVKVLTIHDIKLPLFMLIGSWVMGCLIETCQLAVHYVHRKKSPT